MDHLADATGEIALSGQISRSVVRVVAMILFEAPYAVALVLSEPIVSCQSLHV
jgi:hypothetical protein